MSKNFSTDTSIITLDYCLFSYTGEASIVVSHVNKLIEGGVKPADIAVIAPYNLQVGRGDTSLVILLNSILILYIQTLKPFIIVNKKRKFVCLMRCVNCYVEMAKSINPDQTGPSGAG